MVIIILLVMELIVMKVVTVKTSFINIILCALPVVLYGCETWSLTLREESRLRVFENRILRRTFGPKRDENGEWRKLQNEELHSLYRSPNILRVINSRRLRWAGHVARMEEGRSVFKILTRKPIVTLTTVGEWYKL